MLPRNEPDLDQLVKKQHQSQEKRQAQMFIEERFPGRQKAWKAKGLQSRPFGESRFRGKRFNDQRMYQIGERGGKISIRGPLRERLNQTAATTVRW